MLPFYYEFIVSWHGNNIAVALYIVHGNTSFNNISNFLDVKSYKDKYKYFLILYV